MILFYVVYRVFLLSLTKSILEKKRKRAVFHKLITFLLNEGRFGSKKRQISRERKESKKNDQKRRLFSLLPFFTCFFSCFPLFLTRQSVISRQSLPFLFLTNSRVFASLRKALLVACAHTAQRAIFRDTNTPELAHAHKYTHTHKKGTNNFLSLFIPLSLSLFLSIRCFSSSRVQRQRDDDDDDSMSLARPHQPFGKFKSSSSRGNEEKEERDTSNEKTQSAQISLHVSFCLFFSLCLSVSFCRFSEY